jgi:hypothetical protein
VQRSRGHLAWEEEKYMKIRNSIWPLVAFFAGALAMSASITAQEQQRLNKKLPRYTITDLGTLGGTFGAAQGINNRGWVEGFARLRDDHCGAGRITPVRPADEPLAPNL